MKTMAISLLLCFAFSVSFAAKPETHEFDVVLNQADLDRLKEPPHKVPVRAWADFGVRTPEQLNKMSLASQKSGQKRQPTGKIKASKDNLSKELNDIRDELVKIDDGYAYAAFLTKHNAKYNSYPADAKFVIARLATMIPLKGVVWRTVPAIHQTVITQEMLLSQMKNMGENLMVHQPDGHVKAQLAFFTMPFPDLVEQKEVKTTFGTKRIFAKRFYNEADVITFMSTEVYGSLMQAIQRLEALADNYQPSQPIVFDAKIRFGDDAFNVEGKYDDHDRFRLIGKAELYAQIARYHRRLAAISQMAAYNWNGYVSLTKEIGRAYGVDATKSSMFDFFKEEIYIKGVDRKDRIAITRQPKYANLLKRTANGVDWMRGAYGHYQANIKYLTDAWNEIRDDRDPSDYALLDAEVMQGRKEQVQKGVDNLNRLINGDSSDGRTSVRGELTGSTVTVNVKAFYWNPPSDLKNLLATEFAAHEDVNLEKLKKTFGPLTVERRDMVVMKINGVEAPWRNYLHGRATGWNASNEGFGRLFPGTVSKNIPRARRILGETRGARFLTNNIMMWVK